MRLGIGLQVTRRSGLYRENDLSWSEAFDNAVWVKSNATVTADAAIAPGGTTSADKLLENTTSAAHLAVQTGSKSAVAQSWCLSVHAKAAERSRIQLMLYGSSTANSVTATFDLSSGTIGIAAASGGTFSSAKASIIVVSQGFFRCILSGTTDTSTGLNSRFNLDNGTTTIYAGAATNGLYVWGAQLNPGTTALPYLKKTG